MRAIPRSVNRRRLLMLVITLGASLLCGCAAQRTGSMHPEAGGSGVALTLYSLPDGALIRGQEAVSGEVFRGQYYDLGGPLPAAFREELPATTRLTGFAYGSIAGDQGTLIDCHILLGEDLPLPAAVLEVKGPHGLGLCRDGWGAPYRLLF